MPSALPVRGTEWRLSLATFLGVFLSILGVGIATMPFLLNAVERTYYQLQADVNRRQVHAMSQFVRARLATGASLDVVVEELQAAVEGTQTDRGYLCLIDQAAVQYLSHPDLEALGMAVKPQATFDADFSDGDLDLWQDYLRRGETAAGLLRLGPEMVPEIVYFAAVPGTGWTLSSHENANRIQTEIKGFRQLLTGAAALLGLLVALPASIVARRVSRRSERQLQERNAFERRVLELENARKSQELEEARKLQLSMLPQRAPRQAGFECAGILQTATEVGGDYYDFDEAEDGTLTLAIGDATGHGAQAGILVVAAKSLFQVVASEPDLAAALRRFSAALRGMGLPRLHMAFALGRLTGRTLELAGSAMPPALVYRASDGNVESVPLHGTPLGSPIQSPVHTVRLALQPGDTVMLMSDGLPECQNQDGEMFDYERVTETFAAVAAEGSADEIVAGLVAAGERWSGQVDAEEAKRPEDDMTFVVVRIPHTG